MGGERSLWGQREFIGSESSLWGAKGVYGGRKEFMVDEGNL